MSKASDYQASAQRYYELISQGMPAPQAFREAFPSGIPTAQDRAKETAKQSQNQAYGQVGGLIAGALGTKGVINAVTGKPILGETITNWITGEGAKEAAKQVATQATTQAATQVGSELASSFAADAAANAAWNAGADIATSAAASGGSQVASQVGAQALSEGASQGASQLATQVPVAGPSYLAAVPYIGVQGIKFLVEHTPFGRDQTRRPYNPDEIAVDMPDKLSLLGRQLEGWANLDLEGRKQLLDVAHDARLLAIPGRGKHDEEGNIVTKTRSPEYLNWSRYMRNPATRLDHNSKWYRGNAADVPTEQEIQGAYWLTNDKREELLRALRAMNAIQASPLEAQTSEGPALGSELMGALNTAMPQQRPTTEGAQQMNWLAGEGSPWGQINWNDLPSAPGATPNMQSNPFNNGTYIPPEQLNIPGALLQNVVNRQMQQR